MRYSQFFQFFGVDLGFSPQDKLQRGAEPVVTLKRGRCDVDSLGVYQSEIEIRSAVSEFQL